MALALTLVTLPRASERRYAVGEEATHVDFVRLDLIAGRRHRRGLFSINHNANTMLHTLSNLTGNFKPWHKDQMQMQEPGNNNNM